MSFTYQVFDFYKRPNPELSPAKAAVEDVSHLMENKGIQLLGQIRHGSCRPRAILFKVLADSVSLDSKLMVVMHYFVFRLMLFFSRLSFIIT